MFQSLRVISRNTNNTNENTRNAKSINVMSIMCDGNRCRMKDSEVKMNEEDEFIGNDSDDQDANNGDMQLLKELLNCILQPIYRNVSTCVI